MTVSEKHAEWISLLEVSGPFLAVSVLEDAFPQGLEKVDTPARQRIRAAYDEWRDAVDDSDSQLDALHREWVRLVVEGLLEYDASVLKSGTDIPPALQHHDTQSDSTFLPNFAIMAGEKPKLLISVTPPDTDLENPLPAETWLASPAERLIALCRTCGVPVGLITNGDRWMVVSVPAGGGSSRASWYARLWFQEPVTLQAFCSLLGVRRCFGTEKETLDALLLKSLEHQDEVTDTLGEQVRRAVEVLVQALDRADQDRNRTLLKDVTPAQLFEAGLTVMMRLVVVLCAEERKLLLLGEPVYDQNYAISTLRAQLAGQASHGLEILERREDAWSRLLATFRGIYGGISHETLRLPALGGSLFDPDRFPFLEGRAVGTSWRDTPAVPLPIDNRTVLLLLSALQVLEHKSGAQLLSYEFLDVEQIGHVYEGLLERTVKRVPEVTLGLLANSSVRKKTGHPELYLSELEKVAKAGRENLVAFVIEKTGRSKSALGNALTDPLAQKAANRLLAACGGDLQLTARIKPFALLLREDSWEDPLVYRDNAFIVTHGVGRRETGSHYTPKSLTEPIVQHTLEPLVYAGPAEGKPREEWKLKTPAELLALKVCDMAMGSGAFLVQTCRYLGERLVEAWDEEEKTGRFISIEGVALEQPGDAELLPGEKTERVLIARRLVASRCLYGVDINHMAVELAKLSLWLVTMMRNRPFNFLDHALKCGDSLLGIGNSKQLERFSLRNADDMQPLLETANLWRHIEQAATLRRELEALPSHTTAQIKEKARLHGEAETQLAKLRAAADFLVAAELASHDGRGWATRRAVAASHMQAAWRKEVNEFQRLAASELQGRRPFHWPLEFPEIFDGIERDAPFRGFDAFVGNPPFMGGTLATEALGESYMALLQTLYPPWHGKADYVIGFFKRCALLLSAEGKASLISTSSLLRGETLDSGLRQLREGGWQIYAARSPFLWPGAANTEAVSISLTRDWRGKFLLDGVHVEGISEELTPGMADGLAPYELLKGGLIGQLGIKLCPANREISLAKFQEASRVSPLFAEIFVPAVGGDEFYELLDLSLARRAIDPAKLRALYAQGSKFPANSLIAVGSANDYTHSAPANGLHHLLARNQLAFACGETSTILRFAQVPREGCILKHKLIVFPASDWSTFALLQSEVHAHWAWRWGLRRKQDLVYSAKRCALTFPLPPRMDSQFDAGPAVLNTFGKRYHDGRQVVMLARREGLTKTYNRFHDPTEESDDIIKLRGMQRQLDAAVAGSYGWADLAANEGAALFHDFHESRQGPRWTFHPDVCRDILERLVVLNHQRHAEEVAACLHDKKAKKAAAGPNRGRKAKASATPLDEDLNFDF